MLHPTWRYLQAFYLMQTRIYWKPTTNFTNITYNDWKSRFKPSKNRLSTRLTTKCLLNQLSEILQSGRSILEKFKDVQMITFLKYTFTFMNIAEEFSASKFNLYSFYKQDPRKSDANRGKLHHRVFSGSNQRSNKPALERTVATTPSEQVNLW